MTIHRRCIPKRAACRGRLWKAGATVLTAAALLAPGPAQAGSGRVNSNGTIDVTINMRFPPTAANLQAVRDQATQASHILWDSTEGQLRFGNVTLTCGSVNEDLADMWVFAQPGRAGVSFWNDGSGLGRAGSHVSQFLPSSDAIVIAHEFAHLALGLADEYSEQSRFGACWGYGQCIETANLSEQNQCLMQQPGGFTQTEFCTAGAHDTVMGNNTSCIVAPAANGAPCATNCAFWNTNTLRYETTQQSDISGEACWPRLTRNFSFLTAPTGLPTAAEPGGWTAPNFIEQCGATNTVLLVLDKSGSMAWNVNSDAGEVCGNGIDDDGDGTVDEMADCTQPRMEFVKAAARAYLDLANGQGVRAGIVSFDGTPFADSNFLSVSGSNTTTLKNKVNALSPGGCTAIGDALIYSKTLFDLDAATVESNKTAFLLTDGFNTCGASDPASAANVLKNAGIRVFTIPTGDASNDPSLSTIAGTTGGSRVDAKNPSALVAAFVQQWANYQNGSVLIPKLPYIVDARSNFSEREKGMTRTAVNWITGKEAPYFGADNPARNNGFAFPVEEGTQIFSFVLAGDMSDMSGFGVRAQLKDPLGNMFDTDAPSPEMNVVRDGFYLMCTFKGPNPGLWELDVTSGGGAAPHQTGNLTIISDNPRADMFASLDRYVVDDPSIPLDLRLVPYFDTALHGVEFEVQVRRPDGSLVGVPVDVQPSTGTYSAKIIDFPMAGLYEVRVRMLTTPATMNDPGESIFDSAPPNTVPVPEFERTKSLYFVRQGGEWVCTGDNREDCDGDGIYEDCGVDTDKDGIPDCFDTDSDNDETPDANEFHPNRPDLDGDKIPDWQDPDADNDGVMDANDPNIAIRQRGDVNDDGTLDLLDIREVLRIAGGLTTSNPGAVAAADVIPDSLLTIQDALALLRQQASIKGGVVTVTAANRYSTYGVYLDDPALNGNPGAGLLAGHRFTNTYNGILATWYHPVEQKWVLYNDDVSTMEVGERFHYATGATILRETRGATNNGMSHGIRFDSASLNGKPDAAPLSIHEYVGAYNTSPLGVWYDGSSWWAYNENVASMTDGERYHVLDAGTQGGKVIVSAANRYNTYGVYLDDPRLNGNPNAVVLAQHAWQGQYHTTPVGVWYDAGAGRWLAYHENPGEPMELGEVIHYLIAN